MEYYLVTYCRGEYTYTQVSKDEFETAKSVEIRIYAENGLDGSFDERPSLSTCEGVTDVYFHYINKDEEGEFFFGFIVSDVKE